MADGCKYGARLHVPKGVDDSSQRSVLQGTKVCVDGRIETVAGLGSNVVF